MLVHLLVEGGLDEAVAKKLVALTGHTVGNSYGKRGVGHVKDKVAKYNEAAKNVPMTGWLALVDCMDTIEKCAARIPLQWLPSRGANFLLRVVVNEIESWLLADPTNLSRFLGIASSKIPRQPESLRDPKQTLVNLARNSRSRKIRTGIVPSGNSQEGREYTALLAEFVENSWSAMSAASTAPSLTRALERLRGLV